MPDIAQSYDEIPYASWPLTSLQPARLAALAQLFGMPFAPPQTARTLEIGCASGGHIIPLAYASPQAHFTGVDLSPVQIHDGQARVKRLGLHNVDLQCRSLTEIGAADGQFDYIVCHGVYSWVPEPVRQAILRLCRARLAPEGIAVVSYNVLPGWRLFQVVRDSLLLHAGAAESHAGRATRSRQLFDVMQKQAAAGTTYGRVWREEARRMAELPDFYLAHEIFEADNTPFAFRDFAAAAAEHGLAFLAETSLRSMIPESLGEGAGEAIRALSGEELLATEQYGDILSGRTFRQTLLVHGERAAAVDRSLDPARLAGLHFTASKGFRVLPSAADGVLTFDDGFGTQTSTGDPDVARAVEIFATRLPSSSNLDDLCPADGEARGTVAAAFMNMACGNLIALSVLPVACAAGSIVHPKAWPLAASDVAAGETIVATPRHEKLALDSIGRLLVPLLDGSRTRADLIAQVFALAQGGALHVRDTSGALIVDGERLRDITEKSVDGCLRGLALSGVLVT